MSIDRADKPWLTEILQLYMQANIHSPTTHPWKASQPCWGGAPLEAGSELAVRPVRRMARLLVASPLAVFLLRCCLALSRSVSSVSVSNADDKMPDPPDSTWVYLGHHSIGNSAACGTGSHCSNLDPPNQLVQEHCPASKGGTKCMDQATKACASRPTCVAFAFCNVGSEDTVKITRYICNTCGAYFTGIICAGTVLVSC
jgi:hypothetical protein